jgi:hypothetical protein
MISPPKRLALVCWVLGLAPCRIVAVNKYELATGRQFETSDAPSDVPSETPSSVPSPSPRISSLRPNAIKSAKPVASSVPTVTFEDQGVPQTCSGTIKLEDGVPYPVSPIGPGEDETYCFEPTTPADGTVLYCYTSCTNDRVCNSDFNEYIASDALLHMHTYGMGAFDDSICASDHFYNNAEYCSVPLETSKMQRGVEVQVRNTLVNSNVLDWAGQMHDVTVTCSTSLPPCRGSFLTPHGKDGNGNEIYVSDNFSLSEYKIDPNRKFNLPPMYADFCFDDFQPGSTVECVARCSSSACGGLPTIILERNYPSRDSLCKSKAESCSVIADGALERLIVRVRAAQDRGPLIDYGVLCTVITPSK